MLKTFKGGLHIPDCKNTRNLAIVEMPEPEKVYIPMQQHIGAPANVLVAKGDTVKKGQLIGNFENGLSCPVHASVSGTVCDIEMRQSANGGAKVAHVVIQNDYSDTLDESIRPYEGDIFSATSEKIIEIVRNAGICGQGGASFPTYAKIQSAIGKAKEIIINCAECEPYITENHRLMLEESEKIIGGARILMHACGTTHMTIAVENNKKDAAAVMKKEAENLSFVDVELLKTKYPQGDERQLMYAIKGVELPAGKLPADVGCVIFNAETCVSVYNAVCYGMPLIDTYFTVDGDAINEPKNIKAPIGTRISDIIEFCGGEKENLAKIVSGGPMMGLAQWDRDSVIMKNTSALLFLSDKTQDNEIGSCIHCGRCVGVCPMHLMPNYLAQFSSAKDNENAEKFGVLSCVECGSCTYICPGNVPIVQYIRSSKGEILAQREKDAQKSKESEAKK